jgi:diadenylate cyclase
VLESLLQFIAKRSARDAVIDLVDILLVTWVIYRAFLVLRGTRAVQMGTGLGLIFGLYVVSKWVGFVTLFNLLSTLLSSIILVVVVIFQNDIRRVLMRVGASAVFGGVAKQQASKVIEEVVSAATELARHRIGAIICFEQSANLDEFAASAGTIIDAKVQRDLLVSLFVPEGVNRLHDGAVIIRNLRVAVAGAFFPMPDTRGIDRALGTRHRAALGISEETDAVVVVVSEERGTISVCFNGNLIPNLDGAALREALAGLFGDDGQASKPRRTSKSAQRGLTRASDAGVNPGGVVQYPNARPAAATPLTADRASVSESALNPPARLSAAGHDAPRSQGVRQKATTEPSTRAMEPTTVEPVPTKELT